MCIYVFALKLQKEDILSYKNSVFTQTFTYIKKCWSLMRVKVRLPKNRPSAKGAGRDVDVIAGERTERRLLIIKKNDRS